MKYFRVLPTDKRFKALTDNQKLLILYAFEEFPATLEDIQENAKRKEQTVPKATKKEFVDAGMDDDEAEWYADQIRAASDPEFAATLKDKYPDVFNGKNSEDES